MSEQVNGQGREAATADTDFRDLCDEVVAAMARFGVPGAAVGVLRDGVAYAAGFGITNVAAPVAVDDHTLFQIGSITKTFTGTAIMRLVEAGKLDLDASVRTYLPELRLRDEEVAARVTIRHLLNHTGGWLGDYFDDTGMGDDALAQIVARVAELPQWTPLGQYFSYNNAGFYLAGRIIEVITGQTYEAALQALVLDPLGMAESFFFAADCISRRVAVGHTVGETGATVARSWALPRAAHAVGGISASVRDVLTYARFQLGDGTTPDGTRLLTRDTLTTMQTATTPAGSGAGSVGLTWMVKDLAGVRTVRHTGGTNGQISVLLLVPARRFALTIVTNADQGSELHSAVVPGALRRFCGIDSAPPAPPARAADALVPYAGVYRGALNDIEITLAEATLSLQTRPKGGFPQRDTPPGATPPPTRIATYDDDTLIALDPPYTDGRGEFLRDKAGAIAWIRFGSRLARRER